jgi:hypothetical protein
LKDTLEWVTHQSSLQQQIKDKCQDALDEVEDGQDADEEDEGATDL